MLFVSHNMAAVASLCSRAIWLQNGHIRASGPAEDIVSSYLAEATASDTGAAEIVFPDRPEASSQFTRMCTRTVTGEICNRFRHSEGFVTEMEYVVRSPLDGASLYWMLQRADGVEVMGSGEEDLTGTETPRQPSRYLASVRFPGGILNAGFYTYRVALRHRGRIETYGYGGYIEIVDDTSFAKVGGSRAGVVLQLLDWKTEKIEE